MKKLVAGLAAATTLVVVAPSTVSGDVTGLLIQAAMEDLVAWDPEFAEIAPTAAPESHHQFVAGSQKVTEGELFQHVRVSAHSGPGGLDPHGSVRLTHNLEGTIVDVKGEVECLDVVSAVAILNARLRGPGPNGTTHVVLELLDGGNPGPSMGESPDVARFGFTSAPPQQPPCGVSDMELFGKPRGNLVVKDDGLP
jgi:hypothetical protein